MATGTETNARILVIEDDRDVREVVAQILEHEGFEVRHAENGEAALALLRRNYRPDLIILNLSMPVMNGWAFRAEQLQHAEWTSIPVVLLSAAPNLEATARTLSVDRFLPKPLFVPDLLREVSAMLRQQRGCG